MQAEADGTAKQGERQIVAEHRVREVNGKTQKREYPHRIGNDDAFVATRVLTEI